MPNPDHNRRLLLRRRPTGLPVATDFELVVQAVPEPVEGSVLIRNHYCSLDPAIRGWLEDAPSYIAPIAINDPVRAIAVGQVVASRHPDFKPDDWVFGMTALEDYTVAVPDGFLRRIDPSRAPLTNYLSALGAVGVTAYFGVTEICRPHAGETLLVSGAAGAVGSLVGQIAKIKGCRVVGIAGSTEKCDWAVRELGFDACVDHSSAAFGRSLADACTKGAAGGGAAGRGIDVYFENVGGKVFQTVVPLLNPFARIPVCGLISAYNEPKQPADGEFAAALMRAVLVKRLTLRGFIFSDAYGQRRDEFLTALGGWVREGRIKYREDVVRGLENAPDAFLGLLEGRNFGKLVVDVGGAGT